MINSNQFKLCQQRAKIDKAKNGISNVHVVYQENTRDAKQIILPLCADTKQQQITKMKSPEDKNRAHLAAKGTKGWEKFLFAYWSMSKDEKNMEIFTVNKNNYRFQFCKLP